LGEAEDDSVIMPAPPVEYLAHHPHAVAPPRPGQVGGISRSARFRQTLVPVLLTSGLLMLVTTLLKYTVNPDAPLAAMPAWMAVLLAVSGVALLVVAALNVVQLGR
jgi:hypothetical protein